MAQFEYIVRPSFDGCAIKPTNSWQKAIDHFVEYKVKGHAQANIEVYDSTVLKRVVVNTRGVKEWSNYLMKNKYNRVEKRLMNEMIDDHLEVINTKDDFNDYSGETQPQPDVKGYDLSEYNSFDEYGFYGENNPPLPPMKEKTFRDEIPELMGKTFPEKDDVINPKHYKLIPKEAYKKHPEGLEYFDLMEYVLAHHDPYVAHGLGQAFKYLLRAGKKDPLAQDLKKAKWYLDRTIKNIEAVEEIAADYPDFVNGDVA